MRWSMQDDQDELQAVWVHLAGYGICQSFKRQSYIYSPDQPAHTLFLLERGQVTLQLPSDEGRVLTFEVVEPGQLFGHMALVPEAHYDTGAEASKPCEVQAINRSLV